MLPRFLFFLLFLALIVRSDVISNATETPIVNNDSDSSETASLVEKQNENLKNDLKTTLKHMNQPKSINR
jgi:hypothetical protein